MAKLTWGKASKRIVETGVSKGVLYPDGGKGVVWNGIISIASNADGGEPSDLYANNAKYGSLRSPENFKGTITAYTYPQEFEMCDGRTTVTPGLNIGQQKRLPFNFCYRTEQFAGNSKNIGYKIHLIYNAHASPAKITYETINDSPDAMKYSWDFNTTPIVVDGFKPFAEIILDSNTIDWLNLEELEKILYGLGDDDAAMPSPEFIFNLISMNKVARMIMDVINTHGHWIWDTFNFLEDTVPKAIDRESARHVFKNPDHSVHYIQPSVAYSLLSADKDHQTFSVTVVDQKNPSQLAEDLKTALNLVEDVDLITGLWSITEGIPPDNFYYYPYILTI